MSPKINMIQNKIDIICPYSKEQEKAIEIKSPNPYKKFYSNMERITCNKSVYCQYGECVYRPND